MGGELRGEAGEGSGLGRITGGHWLLRLPLWLPSDSDKSARAPRPGSDWSLFCRIPVAAEQGVQEGTPLECSGEG